jgi:serine/threonine protein phosphatase PrpC
VLTYEMLSERGGREINEDAAACLRREDEYCFVVADGLGGHGQGDAAAQKVTEVFEQALAAPAAEDEDGGAFLAATLDRAQQEILDMQAREKSSLGMKTTAVALSIRDGRCRWIHVGDSRLYVFAGGRVLTRTLDHSVPQMLVLAGEIKEKQIRRHPDRNRLLRALGVEWETPPYVLAEEKKLADCQAFLLCTDGFWEWIKEKKMCALLKKSATAGEWLEAMRRAVLKAGAKHDMDNYTAIAVRC